MEGVDGGDAGNRLSAVFDVGEYAERSWMKKSVTRWEYRRRSANLFNEITIMREMGEEGWQLCAVWLFLLYFRRPVQEQTD